MSKGEVLYATHSVIGCRCSQYEVYYPIRDEL